MAAQADAADIPLVAAHLGHLDPTVAAVAMEALRSFGRSALDELERLDRSALDDVSRRQAREALLRDHVRACCRRDTAVNPYRIEYEGRTDELFSPGYELDDLLLSMLREALPEIRQDLSGYRNYYYYQRRGPWEQPFIEYGALAVSALAQRAPETLKSEFLEHFRDAGSEDWRWRWNEYAGVTEALAVFFASRGHTAVLRQILLATENRLRWDSNPDSTASIHLRAASMTLYGLGDTELALQRLDLALDKLGASISSVAAEACYLKARILIGRGDSGGALRLLEQAVETSDSAPVLLLVDTAFQALEGNRRFQRILGFCRLIQRRIPPSLRPWSANGEDR